MESSLHITPLASFECEGQFSHHSSDTTTTNAPSIWLNLTATGYPVGASLTQSQRDLAACLATPSESLEEEDELSRIQRSTRARGGGSGASQAGMKIGVAEACAQRSSMAGRCVCVCVCLCARAA